MIKFNRNELAGAFGDIGTDFPLLVAIILATGLYAPGVLIVFGIMQILTGIVYKMPMPVQPLKAMAAIVITQKIAGPVLLGAGLAIGIVMFILSASGLLDKIAQWIPKIVIRGIQFGLGMSLCNLALKEYIPSEGGIGFLLAFISFLIIVILIDHRKFPASLLVISLGIFYAIFQNHAFDNVVKSFGFNLPTFILPAKEDILKGFLLLAIPQIPLSLGNSILATRQVSKDLFPDRPPLSIKKIGFTYSIMNLLVPFMGGIPVCHGSGGMVGHYAFGGRTGGSVIIYGIIYLLIGFFFGKGFADIIHVFPLPILGVILVFEGLSLILLIRDITDDKRGLVIAIMVGIMAFGLPYGFIIAMLMGTILYYLPLEMETLKNIGKGQSR
ncbi:MAG: hypothetical protein RJA52_345 [Bacteroidota bacterium]